MEFSMRCDKCLLHEYESIMRMFIIAPINTLMFIKQTIKKTSCKRCLKMYNASLAEMKERILR